MVVGLNLKNGQHVSQTVEKELKTGQELALTLLPPMVEQIVTEKEMKRNPVKITTVQVLLTHFR